MTIVLAALVGGALFLGLAAWLGAPATVSLAAACAILVVAGVGFDLRRMAGDRRVAQRRWAEWEREAAVRRAVEAAGRALERPRRRRG